MLKRGCRAYFYVLYIFFIINKKLIKKKIDKIYKVLPGLLQSLAKCDLCPRNCMVDRTVGEKGYCRAPGELVVYNYGPHHGEEPPLSGSKGSGTVFFSHCNMGCVYCQNWKFSQEDKGEEISARRLSDIMLEMQREGVHNINLVSPTHFSPKILEALKYAYEGGLNLPIVYNTGGYDSKHVIEALDGIIDMYLPDMRYSRDVMARKYSNAPGYVSNNKDIVKEMYRQVGNLQESDGIAKKGLIIRLLVLPEMISGTINTLRFISKDISNEVYLSVMSQYYPAYKTKEHKELSHRILSEEYYPVVEEMNELGFTNGWVQPFQGDFDEKFAGENFETNI